MRSLTLPPDAWSHFCPISFSRVCQVEPLGAKVPSLMTTCARAGPGALTSPTPSNTASNTFFMGSSFRKQIRDARLQPAGASLRQDVDQAMVEIGVDVEGQG